MLFLLPSALFLLFDLGVPSLAVEIKSQGGMGLPSRQRGGLPRVRRVVGWSVFNVLLAVALQAGVEWAVTDVLRMRSLLLIKGSAWSFNHLPNPWSLGKHFVIGLAARNVSLQSCSNSCIGVSANSPVAQILQYYIHLHILHSPRGGQLAAWHQTWHHSITVPYSFVAAYDHPVVYLLYRFLPLAMGSLEDVFTYSGYSVLPSTIMLRGMARRTDAHMMSQGQGNFGSIGILDWAHGTTLGADVVDDLKTEMDKHNVKERSANAIDGAGDKANDAAGGLAAKFRRGSGKGKGRR
jgi:hypothetical protein